MEKELLSIIETVTHFCHILLGFCIHILSDHKNLSFEKFASKRVRRWRLILEEYDYVFKFIPHEQNIIADFLSKWEILPMNRNAIEEVATLETDPDDFPLTFDIIANHQSKCRDLQK